MSFTLTYFDVKGLAEPTRVLFALAGVQFNDIRLPIDTTTFARPEFDTLKVSFSFLYSCAF